MDELNDDDSLGDAEVDALLGLKGIPRETCKKIAKRIGALSKKEQLCVAKHYLCNGGGEVMKEISPLDKYGRNIVDIQRTMDADLRYFESKGVPKSKAREFYQGENSDQRVYRTIHGGRRPNPEIVEKLLERATTCMLENLDNGLSYSTLQKVISTKKKEITNFEDGKSVLEKTLKHYSAKKDVSTRRIKTTENLPCVDAMITLEDGKRIFVKAKSSGTWQNLVVAIGELDFYRDSLQQNGEYHASDRLRIILPSYRDITLAKKFVEYAGRRNIEIYELSKEGEPSKIDG